MKSRSTPGASALGVFAAALATVFSAGLALAQAPAPAPASAASTVAVPPAPKPAPSTAWLLMDYASGQVLAGENIDARVEPASITKVMTSYVIAAEIADGKVKADDQVLMSERAWREGGARTDGSFSGFPVNQRASLHDMEVGMAVQSGNDAAIALAEHVAGTQEAFADLMNSYAARIGMKNSRFANAHGLSAPEHYSTAYDLALLGRAFIRDYPDAYAYNKIKEFTVSGITQPNRNLLLWRDPSVDGIKTGHHSKAGYCLMSSAQRGEQRLIAVVMGGSSERQRADDSLALLNWGFRFHETHRLYEPGKPVAPLKVWKGTSDQVQLGVAEPLLVSVPRGRYGDLQPTMEVPRSLVAPIAAGQQVGMVKVSLDGQVVAHAPLVAATAVEQAGFFKRLWDAFWMWWESD
ncbi:serine-type D-Ala-D-Ala carboxypeptidase [Pseudoxanthomonas broegbernensis]|uniref:serine-type D-Ala-D-Ala carboxypeptidase n=1 Tax=Pseudoxanthomonas broegbernensis TaxID=83619 RepID=A0A7V8K6A7_9GAMM|nr:D-alanyl-D-alanine carboxypeptidase family protein [Pseudoxanthomonas broegbernensis]KAF1685268.1 serine-type D-Ala-D-Ala carboxypeptidase [Pseudoxanthomonas broegbernensis]MBB6066162.1 D-alanyl-D-alanine carboxypeptidase (penicillin-binding protein 5/6) [Pseudoxanthomonas broegbernensis]